MIKKLRRKFITAAMLSVLSVLALIFGTVTVLNYNSIKKSADERIDLIEANGGSFPLWQDFFAVFGIGGDRGRLTPEAPFDTRYFTVRYNSSGEAVSVDTGSIAAVDNSTALRLASGVLGKTRKEGFVSAYRYRVADYINGKLVIFVDTSRELNSFRSFFVTGTAVCAGGLALVFLFAALFSRIAIRPIAESYKKQKRFITDASHELKTPLAIINSANEVIELENGESDWTHSISNQVKRLSELTQSLVTLSRMDEDGFTPQKASFNLSDMCLETAHSFDAVAQSENKSFTVDIQPGIVFNGDKNSIEQLISLLLDNAMKYSDKNGSVSLSLKANGKNKTVTVKNTVDEIEKGNLDILFERFYRSDESRSSQTGGSGIGLSVAKAITEAHGGKITAVSPDGKSAVFTVVL